MQTPSNTIGPIEQDIIENLNETLFDLTDTGYGSPLEIFTLCREELELAGINTPASDTVIDPAEDRYEGYPVVGNVGQDPVFFYFAYYKSDEGPYYAHAELLIGEDELKDVLFDPIDPNQVLEVVDDENLPEDLDEDDILTAS